MDLNLAMLVEATREDKEAHQQEEDLYQQQVLGQEVAQEAAQNLLLERRGHHYQGKAVADGAGHREHMFDKVVTPSDVGKLNRLVVPKQHAERYFPSAAAGTQLCFEDRDGMPWRFRYSYWGSSQSYVMTKGWSRFVRAARLAAGDTVSFSRAGGRYFIDYRHCLRRRRDISFGSAVQAASGGSATMILDAVPVIASRHIEVGTTGPRSFRLFGVNVECGGHEAAAAVEENVDGDRRSEEREMVMWRNDR